MAKGPRTVLTLPDGTPEPLTGGYTNDVRRDGDVVVRLERTTLESARHRRALDRDARAERSALAELLARPHRAGLAWPGGARVDLLYALTSKARGEPFDPSYVDHLLRALA